MKIRIPQIMNGKTKYVTRNIDPAIIEVLNNNGMRIVQWSESEIAKLEWMYTWVMIDDQDEWERGRNQERILKRLNLLSKPK